MKRLLPLGAFLVLLASCSAGGSFGGSTGRPGNSGRSSNSGNELALLASGSEGSLEWSLYGYGGKLYYTDRLPFTLELIDTENPLPRLPEDAYEKDALWGDFRVYELIRRDRDSVTMLMVPTETGELLFRLPEGFPFETELYLQILSRLDDIEGAEPDAPDEAKRENPQPEGLIIEDRSFHVWIPLTAAAVLLAAAAGFVMYRRMKTPEADVRTLASLLAAFESPGTDAGSASGSASGSEEKPDAAVTFKFYKEVYPLLLRELQAKHPAVKLSDSPAELKAHLEEPSSMNQWALRSLYGLLDDLDRIFYAPDGGKDAAVGFEKNIAVLKDWLASEEAENRTDDTIFRRFRKRGGMEK
ncbi:MAG: hypothetical protein PQJ50_18180 [Spirochaetales bacterium]|nr:hypothetical protein [Spirochaetales bacterium]